MPDITGVRNRRMRVPSLILRRRPRASGAGPAPLVLFRPPRALAVSLRRSVNRLTAFHFAAPQALPAPHCFAVGLASQASEPFGFLGSSGSPAVCLRGSGSRHAPPAASRWSPFATPQALPAPLRFASGLAPFASEPPAVSPRCPRSPSVSSGILFVIPAKAGIQALRIASACPPCEGWNPE